MKLVELNSGHEEIFLAMTREYQAELPEELKLLYRKAPSNSSEFQKFVVECEKQRLDWRPGPKKVSLTRYVLRDGDGPLLANGLMRFPLDDKTEIDGGNLFVDVPPGLRGKGHGSVCLSLLLFEAVRAGMRRVLVTALAADPAGRKVIENNRGQLLDVVKSKNPLRQGAEIARYWIRFG